MSKRRDFIKGVAGLAAGFVAGSCLCRIDLDLPILARLVRLDRLYKDRHEKLRLDAHSSNS